MPSDEELLREGENDRVPPTDEETDLLKEWIRKKFEFPPGADVDLDLMNRQLEPYLNSLNLDDAKKDNIRASLSSRINREDDTQGVIQRNPPSDLPPGAEY